MQKMTIVIKYDENQTPPGIHANMDCLGGKIEAVMFDDALLKLEEAEDHISAMTEQHAN